MYDFSGPGFDWKPHLAEAEGLYPSCLLDYITQMNRAFCCSGGQMSLFAFFCLFSFLLAFKRKKVFGPFRWGFYITTCTGIKYARALQQAPSSCSKGSASSPYHWSSELLERRAPPEHSGQKNKYMILTDGQLSLSLQPRGSGYYFMPRSILFTLNTEDDSAPRRFLVNHSIKALPSEG